MSQIVPLFLRTIIPALWLGWLVYWLGAALNVKLTRWRESLLSRLIYLVPTAVGVLLLAAPSRPFSLLNARFLPPGALVPALGAALVAAGLVLAVWARRHLGGNWSATVTLKEGHTLVRSGPYAAIRHPIYAGLLVGILGTALAIGEWRGIAALVIVLLTFLHKIRLEERRMRESFPDYEAYRRKTAALVPFVY